MQTINTPPDAEAGIVNFLVSPGTGLPDGLMDKVKAILSTKTSLDRIIGMIEQLYGSKSMLNNEARDICGALADWCGRFNFWQFGTTGRGYGIAQAMRRDMGETAPAGYPWPAESADPAPLEQYVPMVPQTPAAPAAAS